MFSIVKGRQEMLYFNMFYNSPPEKKRETGLVTRSRFSMCILRTHKVQCKLYSCNKHSHAEPFPPSLTVFYTCRCIAKTELFYLTFSYLSEGFCRTCCD